MRTLHFLIENWYKFFFRGIQIKVLPAKTLNWSRQRSNWTQHLCCTVDVVLYVATFCIITS